MSTREEDELQGIDRVLLDLKMSKKQLVGINFLFTTYMNIHKDSLTDAFLDQIKIDKNEEYNGINFPDYCFSNFIINIIG